MNAITSSVMACQTVAASRMRSAGEAGANPVQARCGEDRSHAERTVEDTIAQRPGLHISAGDDGQQRPDGGDEEAVSEGADQRGLQLRGVADVPQSAAN